MQKNITPKWWKENLIEALRSFWWKAKNPDLKKYFLDNHSNEISKIKHLEQSINWQLQYCCKSSPNYKNQRRFISEYWCMRMGYK